MLPKLSWCPTSPKEQGIGPSRAQGTMAMAWTWTEPRPWEMFAFSAAQEVGCGQCWAQEPGFTFHFFIRAWDDSVSVLCCAVLVPDVLLQHSWMPVFGLFHKKGTSLCKGILTCWNTVWSHWDTSYSLERLNQAPKQLWAETAISTPFVHPCIDLVLSNLAQLTSNWAWSLARAAVTVGLTSWKPAERPVCSSCHKCLWPISNVYVVQDHINSTN